MKLGVLVRLAEGPEEALAQVAALGFPTCQVQSSGIHLPNPELATRLAEAAARNGVEITTIWAGLPGKHVWDFIDGPTTIGLVPLETRAERLATLKRTADFARQVGVNSITTHVGFIPENPSDPTYPALVAALQEIATYCEGMGQEFWFETGQETPITLLRTMQDMGNQNLGINLDPANLLMYGKANPVDALSIFGDFVRGVHAKDGEYPTNGRALGQEKPLGKGLVNFPRLLAKLANLGYTGALTIEREISGPQQIIDIQTGKQYLKEILASL